MKRRFVRPDDEISEDQEVVVRGGHLDPEILRADALRHRSIYGIDAISVFAPRDTALDELLRNHRWFASRASP